MRCQNIVDLVRERVFVEIIDIEVKSQRVAGMRKASDLNDSHELMHI